MSKRVIYDIPEEYMLSEEEKREILQKIHLQYLILDIDPDTTKEIYETHCFCNGEHNVFSGKVCKLCGKSVYTAVWGTPKNYETRYGINVLDPDMKKKFYKQANWSKNIKYVKPKQNHEGGVLFFNVDVHVTTTDDLLKEHIITLKAKNIIDVTPGTQMKAYTFLNNGKMKDVDAEKNINLNSQTSKNVEIVYHGAETMLEFLMNNKKFADWTGILAAYSQTTSAVSQNSFFLIYLSLYHYKCFEQIVKMKHRSLVNSLILMFTTQPNKESISNKLSELSHFINGDATKGSETFTFPKYIADYLKNTNHYYYDYMFWGEACSREDISLENFKKILESDSFYEFNFNYSATELFMYCDYSLLSIVQYLDKINSKQNSSEKRDTLFILKDYLAMCNQMDIEPEKFPMNLYELHDKLAVHAQEQKNAATSKKIHEVKETITKIVKQDAIENDEYVIILPDDVSDVIKEANAQHNCVASYIQKMANRNTLVFFVRKKNDPNTPWITAEFNKRLIQIVYKYNRSVRETDILKFVNKFTKALITKSPKRDGCIKDIINTFSETQQMAS